MGDYSWQQTVFQNWSKTGFRGYLAATVSSGKTRGGRICIEKYLDFFPLDRVWVVANTKEVINQWKEECKMVPDLEYFTYLGAASRFEKLKREGKERFFPQLLVLDEAHNVLAPTSGRVLDYGVEHILALSATPNGSEKKIGPIFQRVSFEEANIADSTVHLVTFKPTTSEIAKYTRATKSINAHREQWPNSNYMNDSTLQMLYLRRRKVTYNFASRLEHAMTLVRKNKGRTMMLFCTSHDQARAMSQLLDSEGINNSLHLSDHEGLQTFLNKEVDVIVSCRKLNTGFSCTWVDVVIVVSTATSPLTVTQTLGRGIRPDPNNPNKHSDIYFLLARDTSDEALLENKNIFIKDRIKEERIEDYSNN